ncbi:MAG: acyl carrier protein [Chitinophagales bacterium]|nr:acyl carrier protein [Chitinophagales bacterium]
MSTTVTKVKAIIKEQLGVDDEQISLDASFENDLKADSLEMVELIMAFEREYNISIPDEQADQIKTVQDIINYLDANVKV